MFEGLTASSEKLIKKFGRQYTFTRETNGDFNTDTLTPSVVKKSYKSYFIIGETEKGERQDSAVKTGDLKVTATVADFSVGDKVTIGKTEYRIVLVNPVQPNGIPIIYMLSLRS